MDRAQRSFINRMGQSTETDGMSPIAGRLFALLLLSDEPRSLDDLAEELEVSKASVSTDARRLLERRIVERVSLPGDRRDYYELAPDFFAQVIRSRVDRWRQLHRLVRSVGETSNEYSPVVRDRFASIDDIHSFVVDHVDQALTAWEQRAAKAAHSKFAHSKVAHPKVAHSKAASRRRRTA